jgi:hypothetical protein
MAVLPPTMCCIQYELIFIFNPKGYCVTYSATPEKERPAKSELSRKLAKKPICRLVRHSLCALIAEMTWDMDQKITINVSEKKVPEILQISPTQSNIRRR